MKSVSNILLILLSAIKLSSSANMIFILIFFFLIKSKSCFRLFCAFFFFFTYFLLLFYRRYSLLVPNPHWNLTLKCQQHNGLSLLPVWPLWAPEAAAMPGPDSLPAPNTLFNLGALGCTIHCRVPLIRESRQTW